MPHHHSFFSSTFSSAFSAFSTFSSAGASAFLLARILALLSQASLNRFPNFSNSSFEVKRTQNFSILATSSEMSWAAQVQVLLLVLSCSRLPSSCSWRSAQWLMMHLWVVSARASSRTMPDTLCFRIRSSPLPLSFHCLSWKRQALDLNFATSSSCSSPVTFGNSGRSTIFQSPMTSFSTSSSPESPSSPSSWCSPGFLLSSVLNIVEVLYRSLEDRVKTAEVSHNFINYVNNMSDILQM